MECSTNVQSKPISDRIVPVIENVSYEYFFENFLMLNKPCIIKNAALNWNATKFWTESNKPSFDYLRNTYGNCKVTVYNCNEKYFNSQQTIEMKFESYLDYWQSYKVSDKLLYLKDWHLRSYDNNHKFYEVPIYFSSDWLNEYLISCNKEDYRFVYMGPAGSWTPFHQDVFSSYSWSANICGRKKWILFPPNEEKKMLDKLGNLPYDIIEVPANIVSYEIEQQPGEAIFVPSKWHHQVWNLENTISINHNWVNGCNIKVMWEALANNLCCVKREISDCQEMENYTLQCQMILKANFGMDFKDFFQFIKFIAKKRIEAFGKCYENSDINDPMHKKYVYIELTSLKQVLELFNKHSDLSCSSLSGLKLNVHDIFNSLSETLCKFSHLSLP